jgi:hypothetical protein
MTNGRVQLAQKFMAELKLNHITCDKLQFNETHCDRT